MAGDGLAGDGEAGARAARLAALAHALRTPLISLRLALGLLAAAPPGTGADLVDAAGRSAQRLALAVEDLLAAGQLDVGVLGVRSTPLDLRAVVAEAASTIRSSSARSSSVTSRTRSAIPPTLPPTSLPRYPGGGCGTHPSCGSCPRSSRQPQCSATLPSITRYMCMCWIVKDRPVPGTPRYSPRWVPLSVMRPTAKSPSVTTSWSTACRSGKAVRSHRAGPVKASGPRGASALISWLRKSGATNASATSKFPRLKTSSIKCRSIHLVCSDTTSSFRTAASAASLRRHCTLPAPPHARRAPDNRRKTGRTGSGHDAHLIVFIDRVERARADPGRYGGDATLAKPFDIADLLAAVHRLIRPARHAAREAHVDLADRAVGAYEAGEREG